MKFRLMWIAILLSVFAQAQETEFRVELMNRISTDASRKGDLVSVRITSPAAFQGSVMEGKIVQSVSGAKSNGESVLDIDFDILRHQGSVTPINSRIKSVANSRGQVNVDEEGRIIGRAGSSSQAPKNPGLGRAIGGLAGGRTANIGASVDNAVGSLFRVSSNAPNLRFEPGAKFTMTASSRSGPALASLAAKQPVSAPASSAAAIVPPAPPAPAMIPAAPVSQAGAALAAPAPAAGQQAASAQPNLTAVKDEFIPGDNTIFYDDFSDMNAGDAPPHFKVRGASPELMAGGSVRQLTFNAKGNIFPNLTGLPKNFTFETEVKMDVPRGRAGFTLILSTKGKQILQWWLTAQEKYIDLVVSLRAPYQELGRKRVPMSFEQPVKLALWVQNGRMRSYANGEKVLDFNQVEMPPIDVVEFENGFLGANPALGYRMVRFAESTPDFSQVLMSSGRYIARGILFDTDRDVIKPESAPVIRQIAQALEKNPALKLLIEGHTDSVGDAAHNLDLSRRRAAAVKEVLVTQFNIDAARLSTAGLGSTKPVDANDTPQGRAQNRRVELVKQ
jgi:OmpA-OmpF porin, OOP family